jgi:hypothetical protein
LFLYNVSIAGRDLKTDIDGTPSNLGLFAEVMVIAGSELEAGRRATQRVQEKLAEPASDRSKLEIEIEAVTPSIKFWRLFRQTGVVFFPET